MLVLSRKTGETIHIGEKVKVSVVKVSGNRVRIGIEAPAGIHIVRGELNEWRDQPFDRPAVVDLSSSPTMPCTT
jgi:carbon storage regulator